MADARDLVDPFGRTVRDLRISITDRCNFRCTYCMPEEGMRWLPRDEILSFEEIERLARVFVTRFAVDGIRLTGGEPTVRAHLPVLVAKLAALRLPDGRRPDLSLTTNGSSFRLLAHDLRLAGLDRVNISLDSLQPQRFQAMTRRNELHRVLDGIAAAQEAGFSPVKLNVVLERGVNDGEVVDFATFGRAHGLTVRFIEFMPLDGAGAWRRDLVVSQAEIVDAVSAVYPLEPVPERGAQPASRWRYADGAGEIGVIPSVTAPFCGACDRVRLTAEGMFRTCLFETREFDLRAILRGGGGDDALAAEIERAVGTKWAGHAIGKVTFLRPNRSMSQIGG
jgi:cyclic pyranopterin phosphate synthase